MTFTSCNDPKVITVTPVGEGTATISASQTNNTTDGSFNLAPVTFTAAVTGAANTAPSVTISGVTGGASYTKGAVPTAMCSVTDVEDGPSSFPAELSAITGPYASDGIGSQTASCSYTDAGGLKASGSATYSIVDATAPSVNYMLSPVTPDGSNGWYKSDVTLEWTFTENESPSSLIKTGCVDQSITADQAETTYSCSATSAGGSAGPVAVSIKRDSTAPTVAYISAAGTAGLNGWYTSPVTATFTATDALSGPAFQSGTANSGLNEEGSAVSISSPAFADNAGNTALGGTTSESFKIDLSNPSAQFDSSIGNVYFGQVPDAPTCTASDEVSGPAGCMVTGYSTAVGTHTLTATATDNAGRTGVATQDYTVLAWDLKGFYAPVDLKGTLNTVKAGSTVPLKFEVVAGTDELRNVSAVGSFTAKQVTCDAGAAVDDVELTTTGGTSLRFDTTGDQFIQNWQTPKSGAGNCYLVTMATQDGSALTASFKLK